MGPNDDLFIKSKHVTFYVTKLVVFHIQSDLNLSTISWGYLLNENIIQDLRPN